MRALRSPVRRRGIVVLALSASAVLAGCSAAAPASDQRSPSATASSTEESAPDSSASRLLVPDEFADVVSGDQPVVINVHTPDEGSIAGTDAAIPFDELRARPDELPTDTTTPLALYCRSGSMSAEASVTLAEMGYTDIVELRGGMNGWTASGRDLLPS